MGYLVAATVLLAALTSLQLVILLGVVRRLRQHADALGRLAAGQNPITVIPGPGTTVTAFAAVTSEGSAITLEDLADGMLVGFFSPDCAPCVDELPRFVTYARTHAVDTQHVLAVLIGTDRACASMAEQLAGVAHVVVERPGGQVQAAFGVTGSPAVALLDADRRIIASGTKVDALRTAVLS